LKTKDQVLSAFKEFHALVEREIGKKFKCLKADNGGEYRGPFEAYCKMYGIRMINTPPKTPQLNGVAERMNCTIEEKGEWIKAMEEEINYLHENHTYDLVELPKGRKALKNKWVYRLKIEEES